MGIYYRDDDEAAKEQIFRDQTRAAYSGKVVPFPKMVREVCAYCTDGRVLVGDGTEYPGGVMCAACSGFGYLVTEQR